MLRKEIGRAELLFIPPYTYSSECLEIESLCRVLWKTLRKRS
jgi:hypothetical protein